VQRTVFRSEEPPFLWLDVTEPTPQELRALAHTYGLHPQHVQDCLDPEHLPKLERVGGTTFIIVRAWDEAAGPEAASVQEATRKVAIFCAPNLILTIHRRDQPWLLRLFEKHAVALAPATPAEVRRSFVTRILVDLLDGAAASYEVPLEAAELRADAFEGTLFGQEDVTAALRDIYLVKRRLLLIRRMLRHTMAVFHTLTPPGERTEPLMQDLRETVASLGSYCEELLEDVNSLLNIHLGLASHRTSEVMRVLTVFSVFFLPLTFIVGIYGMNFRFMPELTSRWGYPGVWLVLLGVTAGIYIWFRRRRWV
jgi:magnesium transporter